MRFIRHACCITKLLGVAQLKKKIILINSKGHLSIDLINTILPHIKFLIEEQII